MNDIKRLNIKYDSSNKRTNYNGKSERGVLLGIKKKTNQVVEPEFNDEKNKLDKNGLDYGINDDSISMLSNLTKNEVEAIKTENLELKLRLDMMQREMDELKKLLQSNKNNTEVELSTTENNDDDFDINDLKALAEPPQIIAKSTAQDRKKKHINVKKTNS